VISANPTVLADNVKSRKVESRYQKCASQ